MSRTPRVVSMLLIVALSAGMGAAMAQESLLSYGDTATGVIDDATPEHEYHFRAEAGDVVTVALSARSGDLDPMLILTDARGATLTQDDDGGEGKNARVVYRIRAAGVYRIVATRYDRAGGATSGDYELTLDAEAAETSPTPPTVEAGEFGAPPDLGAFAYDRITYGDTVTGAISDDETVQAYAFQGRAGETVMLNVERTGGDLALRVALFDRTGQAAVAEAEDAAGRGGVEISFVLPRTAYYVVGVGRLDGNGALTVGEYGLSLDVVRLPTETLAAPAATTTATPAAEPAITVSLTWAGAADLDLVLYYPSDAATATSIDWRNIAYPEDYPLPQGAVFESDGNGFCQDVAVRPVETITWDADAAPVGDYEILVQYQFACGSLGAPVDFEIALTVDGQTETLTGVVAPPKGEYRTTFAR
ncbi:MAG: PPC domain-containing protein [Anaerolineae bacterium]|nr:PPC domain-containing protein [Anaerolineae bacterium]